MKKKVLMALLLGCACVLVAGCSSKKSPETEAQTEAKAEAQTEAKTGSAEETEADTEAVSEADAEAVSEADTETSSEADAGEEAGVSKEAETEPAKEVAAPAERPQYKALDYVTVGEYKNLPVTIEPIEVTDEDIDQAIEENVAAAELYDELTEGTVKEGDIANIDYVGKKDGVAFDGGTAEGFDLTIGSGRFIPGFEEGLIGVEVGDTVDLDLTFPEAYHSEELAGQAVVFTVTVNSIKTMPEIDDELVNTLSDGAYSTVDGYREFIRQEQQEIKENEQENGIYRELLTQLYNTCTIEDYPQELVDYCASSMKEIYQNYAESYQMEFSDFIEQYFGLAEEDFNTEVLASVKQSLQQELILMAVAEQEGLTVSDEEYQENCAKYAENNGYESVEAMEADYGKALLEINVLMDKTMNFVKDNAVIQEPAETESETGSEMESENE